MIKILLAFVVVFGLFFVGIRTFRAMSGQEQWALTKLLTYSTFCAILTFVFLITLVVLF
jgi:hypothetical protein